MTHYEILQVNTDATAKEITVAYRERAKENHEDLGGEKEKMILINKAYEVLSDPELREHYDKTGLDAKPNFELRFRSYINEKLVKIIDSGFAGEDYLSQLMVNTEKEQRNLTQLLIEVQRRAAKYTTFKANIIDPNHYLLPTIDLVLQQCVIDTEKINLDLEFLSEALVRIKTISETQQNNSVDTSYRSFFTHIPTHL